MKESDIYLNFYKEKYKLDTDINLIYPNDMKMMDLKYNPNKIYTNYLSKIYFNNDIKINHKYFNLIKNIKNKSKNMKIFEYFLKSDINSISSPSIYFQINPQENPFVNFAEDASGKGFFKFAKAKDYKFFLKRFEGFQSMMESLKEILRNGVKNKYVLPTKLIKLLIKQNKSIINNKSYLNHNAPKYFNTQVEYNFINLINDFNEFLKTEYLPFSKSSAGLASYHKGKEIYLEFIRDYTTLELKDGHKEIERIHQLGLDEVKRIEKETKKVLETILKKKFKNQKEYIENRDKFFLDPKNFFKTSKEVLNSISKFRPKIEKEVINTEFNKIKISHQYKVEAIPKHQSQFSSAYYIPATQNNATRGTFYINLLKPQLISKLEMEALLLHEGNPGHHFQLTHWNDKLNSYPAYWKLYSLISYEEGWGLYCENLGKYTDIKQKIGKLSLEMLRALRLVIDTGIHYYNWTPEHAINYFQKHLTKPKESIEKEIWRYISIPGQALSYKIGSLVFEKIRKKWLDNNLDINQFHKTIFDLGELPFTILEKEIESKIHDLTQTSTPKEKR